MTTKMGRNDPCSCGSGEKYKHCCAEKQDTTSSTVSYFGLGAILVAALAGGAVLVYGLAEQESSGRVWSSAHGHFHDVGQKQQPGPQPPGPAPAGKAWSSEHGHWHNAQPNEPAPEGKVWSPEHGHWHDAETGTASAENVSSEPPGPAPPGKVWSSEHGHWHDAP